MPENALGFGLRSRARRPSAVPTREALEAVLYDKAYSWELQPGSDVMATCIGVLPLAFHTSGGRPVWAGLVTIDHALTADEANASVPGFEGMAVLAADTPLTVDGYNDGAFPAAGSPAGVYVVMADIANITGGQPPYAFPAGWTPGNTTGSGPVLPLVGRAYSQNLYAGLVTLDVALSEASWSARPSGWGLVPADSALGAGLADLSNVDVPAPAGAYVAIYFQSDGDLAPTAFPEGWTFRPYGIGPVAITDENAGGLIGDVAYVVSGYVYNGQSPEMAQALEPRYVGTLADGDHTLADGDVFHLPHDTFAKVVNPESGGTFTVTGGDSEDLQNASSGWADPYDGYWPFIERYDLAQKKWLPRIPLPDLGEGNFFATEGGIAGVIDGKLYFGGGDGDVVEGNEFFVYDPADDSITRLADMGNWYADYSPYGVLEGKLWYFNINTDYAAFCYDPTTDEWTGEQTPEPKMSNVVTDQVQGFEIDGKLWFVYNGAAFVFDPVALTVTAKAATAETGGGQTAALLIGGKFYADFDNGSAVYDPAADTWAIRTDVTNRLYGVGNSEMVAVAYDDAQYVLSGVQGLTASPGKAGVYGVADTGLDKPAAERFLVTKPALETRITERLAIEAGQLFPLQVQLSQFGSDAAPTPLEALETTQLGYHGFSVTSEIVVADGLVKLAHPGLYMIGGMGSFIEDASAAGTYRKMWVRAYDAASINFTITQQQVRPAAASGYQPFSMPFVTVYLPANTGLYVHALADGDVGDCSFALQVAKIIADRRT